MWYKTVQRWRKPQPAKRNLLKTHFLCNNQIRHWPRVSCVVLSGLSHLLGEKIA